MAGFWLWGCTGVASLRSCQKLPQCSAEPMTAGSRTERLLAKAGPTRNDGNTSVMADVIAAREKQGENTWVEQLCRHCSPRRRRGAGGPGAGAGLPYRLWWGSRAPVTRGGHWECRESPVACGGDPCWSGWMPDRKLNLWEAHSGVGSWQGPTDPWREEPKLEQVSW